MIFSAVALLAISVSGFANNKLEDLLLDPSCDDAAFDAMEWAFEEGFDDQTVANIGNWAYANCWLRQKSVNNPSF